MQRILSAIFDNCRDAEAAISELVLSGYPRSAIRLSDGDPAEARPSAPARPADGGGNFFHTLFGTDDSSFVRGIDGAVTHSHQVLTVVTADLAEVERAAAIVERYGPIDIDAIGVGEEAAPADAAGAAARLASAARQGASGPLSQQQAEPPGAPHGAPHGDADRLSSGQASQQAGGGNLQRASARAAMEEDAAPRFGGDEHYDEYAPAYLYGLDMAGQEQHGGKAWAEAEPALRGEWEQRHPQSAWSKFRDAVRHGWDRLRSEGRGH